jgi:hypothetical protein
MKNLLTLFLAIILAVSSGFTSRQEKEEKLSRAEKKVIKQQLIKEAVESRQFVINLERLYMTPYGMIDLTRNRNYIIVEGKKAAIRAGYMGRQQGLYPIAGINLAGEPSVYKMKKDKEKGNYRIEFEVSGTSDLFHVVLVISENGYCNATISGAKIDQVRYSGDLNPIIKDKNVPEPDAIRI